MKATLLKVIAGNFTSQLIGLISVPLLLTSYSAAELGFYGYFISASAILSTLVSLRVENLMFAVSERQARSIFFLASVVLFSLLLLSGGIVFVILTNTVGFELYCAAMIGALTLAQFNVAFNFVVRQGRTGVHVWGRIIRNLSELFVIGGCVLIKFPISVLPWLISLTYLVAAIFLAWSSLRVSRSRIASGVPVLWRNLKFIRFDFLASLFNVISLNVPVLFFYGAGAPEISGIFFSVSRVLGTPALMIAQSIGTTLKQHAVVEFAQSGSCKNSVGFVISAVLKRWLAVYISLCALVLLFVYWRWSGSSDTFLIVSILVPLFFARYVYNCIGSIVYVLRLQRDNLIFQIALLMVVICSLYVPASLITALVLYSGLTSAVYLTFFKRLVRVTS